MFASLKRAARNFRVANPADLETEYLNGAVDRIDLEVRQREIDRGLFRRRGGLL
jgi:hypothetical protein